MLKVKTNMVDQIFASVILTKELPKLMEILHLAIILPS